MKIIASILLFIFYSISVINAQFTTDVSKNTLVCNESDVSIADCVSSTTTCGKTYVAYIEYDNSGTWILKLQLLDEQGNKVFQTGSIVLENVGTMNFTAERQIAITHDEKENAIVAFSNWGAGVQLSVYKVNNQGIVIASHNNISGGYGICPNLAKLPNNETLISWYNSGTVATSSLQKLEADGKLAWISAKTIEYECEKLVPLNNGDCYLISSDPIIGTAGYGYGFAQLIDNDGNKKWSKWTAISTLSHSTVYTAEFSCLVGANQELIVANTYFYGGFGRAAYIQNIDQNGNILWGVDGKLLCADPALNYQLYVRITENPSSGEFCAVFGAKDYNDPKQKLYLQKISSSGNLLLGSGGLMLIDDSYDPNLCDLQRCGENYSLLYLATASNGSNPKNNNLLLLKFDDQGSVLKEEEINSNNGDKAPLATISNQPTNGQTVIVFPELRNNKVQLFAQNSTCESAIGCNAAKKLFIPNVFTPNNDGFNDEFEIILEGYKINQFQIFNRWGELVFSKTDNSKSWNGKKQNTKEDAVSGTYFFVLDIEELDSKENSHHTGNVSLFR